MTPNAVEGGGRDLDDCPDGIAISDAVKDAIPDDLDTHERAFAFACFCTPPAHTPTYRIKK